MQEGGIADKLSLENPFDPNSKPINLKFNAERPYFNLPQVRAACWACFSSDTEVLRTRHPVKGCPMS